MCGCSFDFFFVEGTYREYICDAIGPECGVHWVLGVGERRRCRSIMVGVGEVFAYRRENLRRPTLWRSLARLAFRFQPRPEKLALQQQHKIMTATTTSAYTSIRRTQ